MQKHRLALVVWPEQQWRNDRQIHTQGGREDSGKMALEEPWLGLGCMKIDVNLTSCIFVLKINL